MSPWSTIEGEADLRMSTKSNGTCPRGHGVMVKVESKTGNLESEAYRQFNDAGEAPCQFCVVCSGLNPLRKYTPGDPRGVTV